MPGAEVSLVLVRNDGSHREIPLKRARALLGRRMGTDVRIASASVSREHCEVRIEDGKVVVKDLGSSNGTFVNGARVQESEVRAGDVLGVGPELFVVRVAGEPKEIDVVEAVRRSSPARTGAASGGGGRGGGGAGGAGKRPASPSGGKAGGAGRPTKPLDDSDDLLGDLPTTSLDDSSLADVDFDLDDDDDEDATKQPKL